MLQKAIEDKLTEFKLPYLDKHLIDAKAVQTIAVENTNVKLVLRVGFPVAGIKENIIANIKQLLLPIIGQKNLEITLTSRIEPHSGNQGVKALPNVKNIIAVASGKGGVGKSTIALNLALGLHKEGARVGLLDADIYGPSQPTMLGSEGLKPLLEDKLLKPIESKGIQSMSIGYLIDKHAPMMWRGPMLGKAMQQLIHDTAWQDLDYLVIDLPPGTGDVQLTLCQKVPLSAAVIVTTPQDLALLDVRRACAMFLKLNVPILGIIENMSGYQCRNCGHTEHIFGQGGGSKLMQEYHLPLLAEVPLDPMIRIHTDQGESSVAALNGNPYADLFREMARMTAAKLSLQHKDYRARFPNIVVEGRSQ